MSKKLQSEEDDDDDEPQKQRIAILNHKQDGRVPLATGQRERKLGRRERAGEVWDQRHARVADEHGGASLPSSFFFVLCVFGSLVLLLSQHFFSLVYSSSSSSSSYARANLCMIWKTL